MKVYVTQGHEKGIGLEVFIKSCIFLPQIQLNKIILLAYQRSVQRTLEGMKIPFEFNDDSLGLAGKKLPALWIKQKGHSESFTALELGMKLAETGGVLFTLPTSKDQFPGQPGHTEFFRFFYKRPELGMFFSSPRLNVLLLSDHLPLAKVPEVLTQKLLQKRLVNSLKSLMDWKWPIDSVLVAGFNPHAGEDGLIGNEDQRVANVIQDVASTFSFPVRGPFPGDTMLLEQHSHKDILVYLYHDQGLGVFKGKQGFIGSNITLGLPFPRLSPDHGTSFQLFGKNVADYRGCAFSLNEALVLLERIGHGKNPGH